jgi:hypothetical protein
VVAGLTVLALWPVWASDHLALQDYPAHLAQAEVLRSLLAGEAAYPGAYQGELSLAPYLVFHAWTTGLAHGLGMSVDAAGRAFVSVYVLLIAWLGFVAATRGRASGIGWGALALLPAAFHAHYFLGNLGYTLALPMVALALRGLEKGLRAERPWGAAAGQFGWHGALFLVHPFAFLAHAGLSGLALAWCWRHLRSVPRARWLAVPLPLAVAGFLAWFGVRGEALAAAPAWLPIERSLEFACLLFTGLRLTDGVSLPDLAIWLGIGLLLGWSAWQARHAAMPAPEPRLPWGVLAGAVFLVVLALPFQIGHFTYVNLRLVHLAILLALVAVAPRGVWSRAIRVAWVASLAALLLQNAVRHDLLSDEMADAVAVLEPIPAGQRVLPLCVDNDSEALDRLYFDPHLHAHQHYHLAGKGGVTPYLFGQVLSPVRFRPGARPPAPGDYTPRRFGWDEHGRAYDWIVARGAPPELLAYLALGATPIGRRGAWTVHRVTTRSD